MDYTQRQVATAFGLYAELSSKGEIKRENADEYFEDENVRALVEQFAQQVKCTIVSDLTKLYLLPVAQISPFHITNDSFKRLYLPSKAVNLDIYMMYLAIIVLFGKFYDSYQSMEPLEFVTLDGWLASMDERITALKNYDAEMLKRLDAEYDFNWSALIVKWEDVDDVKETVKKQDGRTNSRISFLNIAKNFLEQQNLLLDIGNNEMKLTEKAMVIIQHYYMEQEYNRGILDFMYQFDHKEES
jgi:hypothetical protein